MAASACQCLLLIQGGAWSSVRMQRSLSRIGRLPVIASLAVFTVGCAHHRANQYAYAPPYAPPVYPQPASYQQPVTAAAPVTTQPVVNPPVTIPPTQAVPVSSPPGTVPCQPMVQPTAMQGAPCPQGEYLVPGSVIGDVMPCPPCQ